MGRSFKKLVILSGYLGETPVFKAEMCASGEWEYELGFSAPFDEMIVSDGKENLSFFADNGVIGGLFPESFVVAVVRGGEVLTYGASGMTATRSDVERLVLKEKPYDDEMIADENYYGENYANKYEDAGAQADDIEKSEGFGGEKNARRDDESVHPPLKPHPAPRADRSVEDPDGSYTAPPDEAERKRRNALAVLEARRDFRPLRSVVPLSRWAEVNEKGKTFYFGVQGRGPDNLCFAVKGVKGAAPEGFAEATFYPESPFFGGENGYYVTFEPFDKEK